jgi:hypothetical protein
VQVNGPGRLEVSIEGENGGWAWAFSEVNMALPGSGGDHIAPAFEPTCQNGRPTNIQQGDPEYVFGLAYCQGEAVDTTKANHRAGKAKLDSAFKMIRDRGGICVGIADTLKGLINAGRFRFIVLPFDTTGTLGSDLPYGFDGFAKGGSDPYWAIFLNTAIAGGIILREDVAHEGDHVLDQYDPNGVQTDQAGHLKDGSGKVNLRKTLHSDACSASG